ncbi:flavo protein [Meira miltonrushii]|uniref:Flavo protein n=1 Tax=Meira miltonrushii TaxID=1280837 RepID=A0A316VEI8_9BASI|nr:flavo protein [Meira miltonrushii]PWN36039.1 flavo protein [Meira miltonrushii]
MDESLPKSLRSPYPELSKPPTQDRPLHVVLATTGSVASIKTPLIIERLLSYPNVRIQVISTKASQHFYNKEDIIKASSSSHDSEWQSVKSLAAQNAAAQDAKDKEEDYFDGHCPRLQFWEDEDEWSTWKNVGDPILHIELRRWADIVLIAPCSANTLAKIHAGVCDDLLTSFLRALSPSTPTYLFPAMNTLMHMHPLTDVHVRFAKETLGYNVHGPIQKKLACGDLGNGAMLEWSDIVQIVVDKFGLNPSSSR